MEQEDRIARAYVRIKALQETLSGEPDFGKFHERYVHEYHQALDHLEAVGFNVSEFRIPEAELEKEFQGSSGGEKHYSAELYVDRLLLLTKLKSVLMYFDLATAGQSEGKRTIGFHAPGK